MNERVVLNYKPRTRTVTKVDFLFFPTANLFVACTIANFLADQNFMSRLGGDLTFHFCNETLSGLLMRDMSLNGIINICTDDCQGRFKSKRQDKKDNSVLNSLGI